MTQFDPPADRDPAHRPSATMPSGLGNRSTPVVITL